MPAVLHLGYSVKGHPSHRSGPTIPSRRWSLLVAIAIPLLLAALVQERQRAEEALRQSNRPSWQLAGRLMSA